MPRSPASRKPEPPEAEDRSDRRREVPVADLPPDVLAVIDEPLDPAREALVKAWLRGEGPDPWTVSD